MPRGKSWRVYYDESKRRHRSGRHEARRPGPDLALLLPRRSGGGVGFLQGRRARRRARAHLPRRQLRDGAIDFVGGSAHSALAAFPEWNGAKLLCAQSQGMYWFLVVHRDLGARRGDLSILKGRTIGAAPWVDMGLRRLLIEAGHDPERERITIAPVPGAFVGKSVNFGLTAAKALKERKIDGFWANGMGAEIAVRGGYGTVLIDVRRGDGPKPCFNYTMAAIATTDALIRRSPELAAGAVRAIVKTLRALKEDVSRATTIGRK